MKCIICNKITNKLFKSNTCSFECNSIFQNQQRLQNKKHNFKDTDTCPHCHKNMQKLNLVRHIIKCSISKFCKYCNKPLTNKRNQFCNQSCSTIYHNINKQYGFRRSKFETFVEHTLITDFPNLQFLFNDRKTIDLELDILIPSLKLAFEFNGIVHYEPIYGTDKFNKIKNNDKQKIISCYKKGIELVIIDSTNIISKNQNKYYNLIKEIIEQNYQRTCLH